MFHQLSIRLKSSCQLGAGSAALLHLRKDFPTHTVGQTHESLREERHQKEEGLRFVETKSRRHRFGSIPPEILPEESGSNAKRGNKTEQVEGETSGVG